MQKKTSVASLEIAKRARKDSPSVRRQERVNTKQRILALLTAVVCARCGISRLAVINAAAPGWKHQAWNRFMKGEAALPDRNAKQLEEFLKRTIHNVAKTDPRHPLVRDLCYLRSRVFSELDTEYLQLTERDDQYQLDRELLFSLDIDRERQHPDAVHRRAHGFWFLIRHSTLGEAARSGETEYCVSLLSVSSSAYMRLMGEKKKMPTPVATSLPHFSLRTGVFHPDGSDEERIFRGQIIQSFELKSALNFIGAHDGDSPPLFLMTLKLNEPRTHATEAYGIIHTTNAQTIICGPVGACSVPLSPDIVKMRGELSPSELRTSVPLSRLYRVQRDRLEPLIGRYSEERLVETFEPLCESKSVQNVVRRLRKAREEATNGEYAGFYYVPNA